MDPRESIIEERMSRIKRIIGITAGKGGVGKSLVTVMIGLKLKEIGYEVGIMDLDFACPSVIEILGGEKLYPREDKGIIPPEIEGIKVMSITYYSQNEPLPLRGEEVKEVILELLCITRWGGMDFLVIDMPPGMGESILEIVKWMRKIEFVVVTTNSKIVKPSIIKMISLIKKTNLKLLGVIKNNPHPYLLEGGSWESCVGEIPFDKELERKIGNPAKLRETLFYKTMENIVPVLLNRNG